MAQHKKTPTFLRVVTNDQQILCINPLQLSSFQIEVKAKIKQKDGTIIEADTIRFFFPSGTGLNYSVGVHITQKEFDYVVSTLLEFLYLNEYEFEAKSKAIEKARMDEWNALSEENSKNLNKTEG